MDNQCKLKTKCPLRNNPPELYCCWVEDCPGFIHEGCCNLLLDRCQVELDHRPTEEEQNEAESKIVFCTVGCQKKWYSAKKKALKAAQKGTAVAPKKRKVPWEEDGSLKVLMDWITTEGNYNKHCGANGNKGKSKSQYQKDIAILIKQKIPDWERDGEDVENKINSLEKQFRTACDWAQCTGQGVEDEEQFEAAVLKRCSLFRELEPIMGDRPNAKPLTSNESDDEGQGFTGSLNDNDSDVEDEEEKEPAIMSVEHSLADAPAAKDGSVAASSVTTSSSGKSTGSKRLTAGTAKGGGKKRKGGKESTDEIIQSMFGEDSPDDENSYHKLRVREVEAKERESEVLSQKAKKEMAILSIDERVKLLTARVEMIAKGCTEEQVDQYFPLPSADNGDNKENDNQW